MPQTLFCLRSRAPDALLQGKSDAIYKGNAETVDKSACFSYIFVSKNIEPISFTPIRRDPAGETPYHLPRSWQKSLHSGPPKRRKSHVLSRIFATFGLKKHRTHIIGSDLEGPRGQIPYCCIADLDGSTFGPSATTRPADPTLPSRAHLQDYGRRTTPSNYYYYSYYYYHY